MVGKKYLILFSGLVWLAAGFNVLRIGVIEVTGRFDWLMPLLTIAVFLPFFFMFRRMVFKNIARIHKLESEKNIVLKFLPVKSYILIALMMTIGVIARNIQAVPRYFIAFFYTGLGTSLFLAGVHYLIRFLSTAEL